MVETLKKQTLHCNYAKLTLQHSNYAKLTLKHSNYAKLNTTAQQLRKINKNRENVKQQLTIKEQQFKMSLIIKTN